MSTTAYETTKRIRAQRRRFAVAVKTTAGCIDCGATGPAEKLHFDHRNGEEKRFEIARGGTSAWPVFIAEVMKCDVRCASCHAKRHRADDPITKGFLIGHLTESELEEQVESLASMLGWMWIHFCDSRRQIRPGVYVGDSKARGWPDLILCRERVVHAELKSSSGKLRPQQREWLNALALAGQEVYLWRPGDMDEAAKVLSKKRWRFFGSTPERPPHLATVADGHWTPDSLWLPGVGRHDGGSA